MATGIIAQEREQALPTDVFGTVRAGYSIPIPQGNSFMAEGYDMINGFLMNLDVFPKHTYSLGLQFLVFSGEVTDILRLGDMESTNFWYLHVTGGYPFYFIRNRLALKPSLGFGGAFYNTRKEFTYDFQDRGFSLMGEISLTYRFNKFWGFFFSVRQQWDQMNTRTPEEFREFFTEIPFFSPSFGIQVYLY